MVLCVSARAEKLPLDARGVARQRMVAAVELKWFTEAIYKVNYGIYYFNYYIK